MSAGRAHRQTRPRHPALRAAAAWWCPRSRLGSSAATAPTSSPVAWVGSGCSSPRSWPRRAAAGSCSVRARRPSDTAQETIELHPGDRCRRRGGVRRHRPTRHRASGWWPRQSPPGFRCAVCCTRRQWSRTPRLANITDELIERDWAPKVYGAWNLHQATAGQPLDWFCSFSSAAALLGSPGQGAYAAANSWLDAFTHWRRAQGLPATSIAWGPGPRSAAPRPGGSGARADHSRGGCVRVRGAAAPRPRLHRVRADHRHPVVDRVRPAQPVRRSVPIQRAKPSGHKQVPRRAERSCPWTSGPPGCGVWSPNRSD